MTMDEQTIDPCWDAVDGILVINMDTSPDRYSTFLRNTGCYLPPDKLHRISAVAGRELSDYGKRPWFTEKTGARAPFWGGTAGCVLSHRRAIEYASAQGWHNVLILEDDAALESVVGSRKLLAQSLCHLHGDYMLYLGFNRPTPYGRKVVQGEGCALWQVEGVLATHAYLLPESMYERLLGLLPTADNVWEWLSRYRAIDVFYRDFVSAMQGIRIYAILPVMFCQSDEKSDISGETACCEAYTCRENPHAYTSLGGVCHLLLAPFHRLKVHLNSLRTRRRAAGGGLPGFKKRRK